MLYGQNLPWRIALRQSSQCSASRLRSSSRAVNSVSSRCYYLSNARLPPCTSRRTAPVYTTRQFSSSLQRWKEKPASEGEKATEEQVVDETDSVDPSEDQAKNEKAIDFKSKAPEPIPNPQASDGKGAGAGGNGGESGSGAGGSGDGGGSSSKKRKQSERALQKPMVPEVYPQVMALPIAKRPLFPGFYKAITIRNPNVTAAIYEAVKRGQPYVGAFLLKDENADKDVIESMDDAYEVGTFCQVTSAFAGQGDEGGMTAVLYPHRRIKMSSLIPPSSLGETAKVDAQVVEDALESKQEKDQEQTQDEKKGDVVASFEEGSSEAQQKPEAQKDKKQQQYEPTSFLQKYNVSLVNVDNLAEEPYEKKSATIRALIGEIVNVFKEIASMNHIFRDQISTFSMSQNAGNVGDDPAKLADFAAAVSAGEPHELQDALEALNMEDRLHKALLVLKKELMNAQLQSKISRDVEDKIQKRQREYWLMEQMKGIRRELGLESDGKDKLIENFKEKANKLAMPEGVKKVFDEELNKLAHLETAASEFNVTRNYLDWLTQIPWGQRSPENFGIQHAMTVLDEDHHGLEDVKDRILEFIAVGKLRGTVEGKILCMVGPPGVGKTSIGKSIARALNRQYYRFSVGGLADVAEIKGHRRTYVGALPGRIIQALKKCQTENPLILIDEVDKLGRGHQGDPASALLELLDPEQNNSFLDHYMDVPVDLSKVLFVCTANMTDTIPRPLLDRMEMIELSGYVADEKMAIAERYLAPSAKELTGLKDVDVLLEKEAITELINKYCRESGVRNLKKQIEKVYRKAALKIIKDIGEENTLSESKALTEEGKAAQAEAEKQSEETTDPKETPENIEEATTEKPRVALNVPSDVHVRINTTNLKDYVGSPIFTSDRLYDLTPPGVAMGLAWTSMGGAALYVESILQSGLASSRSPHMQQTGNLKPVMKESSYIAYSFAQSFLAREFPGNRFFELAKIHLHCPEGAVPKDGPSAGITMASSMLSLALNEGVREDVAMTGELTVTGKVLRIGGLREKVVAARRAGAKVVVFPRDNWSDWLELPENIKEGIEGKPVDWYADVFDTLFHNIDRDKANTLWKKEIAKAEKKPARRSKRLKDVEEEEEEDDEADDINPTV